MSRIFPLTVVFLSTFAALHSDEINGFDLNHLSIPKKDVLSGGPPRDGIPSINAPRFVSASKATLGNDDLVISVSLEGETKAYPLRILVWHEIVNDVVGDTPLAVTYCPLCGTAMVFKAEIGGQPRSFGVSGLLYQSDVLLYDRETESLWSQLAMKAVSGPEVGNRLDWVPSQMMKFSAWREKYPEARVLSFETGHKRNYSGSPYQSYFKSKELMFPVKISRKEIKPKAWVIGIIHDGRPVAYSLELLKAEGTLTDTSFDPALQLRYDKDADWVEVQIEGTVPIIPSVRVYWFAWQAFYPATELWQGLQPDHN